MEQRRSAPPGRATIMTELHQQFVILSLLVCVVQAKRCLYYPQSAPLSPFKSKDFHHKELKNVAVKECTWGCCGGQDEEVCCSFPPEVVVVALVCCLSTLIFIAVLISLARYVLTWWRRSGIQQKGRVIFRHGMIRNFGTLIFPYTSSAVRQNYIQLDLECPPTAPGADAIKTSATSESDTVAGDTVSNPSHSSSKLETSKENLKIPEIFVQSSDSQQNSTSNLGLQLPSVETLTHWANSTSNLEVQSLSVQTLAHWANSASSLDLCTQCFEKQRRNSSSVIEPLIRSSTSHGENYPRNILLKPVEGT